MQHYTFGSSTANRTNRCQAWVSQSEGVPRSESTYAMDGTVTHQLLENRALEDDYDFKAQIGKRLQADWPPVTADHVDMAVQMWTATTTLLSEHGAYEWEAETTGKAAEDVGGTLDMIANCGDLALLVDYKTGMGVQVDPVNNAQILFATAVCLIDSPAVDMLQGKTKFLAVIIQPNRGGEVQVKTWEYTIDQVNAFWRDHTQNIEIARTGDTEPVAGGHCTFCPANGLCDATTGNLLRMVQLDASDLEQLAWGLDHIEQVKKTIASIEKIAYQQLEVGAKIDGWKLVKGRPGNTRWIDQEAAIKALRRAFKGKRYIVKESLLTPTQLLALAKKQDITDKVKPIVEGLTERPESNKNTLARESDKRPAILSSEALAASLNSIK